MILLTRPVRSQPAGYSYTDLNPSGFTASGGHGNSGSQEIGYGSGLKTRGYSHALLWSSTKVLDLNPGGFAGSFAFAFSGNHQIGYGWGPFGTNYHALLWSGPASVMDMNPSGFDGSATYGISGNQQVGYGYGGYNSPKSAIKNYAYSQHALLWSGRASGVVDLNPSDFSGSDAYQTSGSHQVGHGWRSDSKFHALMWSGTASSVVDLNPSGFDGSDATGLSGNQEVGDGWGPGTGGIPHALLWSGSASSAVDLNPSGFAGSFAYGILGNQEVGYGWGPSTGNHKHALLWSGSAAAVVDLHTFLSSDYSDSTATGVDTNGNIIGYATYIPTGDSHAIVWTPAINILTLDPNTQQPTAPRLFPSVLRVNLPVNGWTSRYQNGFPVVLLLQIEGPPSIGLKVFVSSDVTSGGHIHKDTQGLERPHGWLRTKDQGWQNWPPFHGQPGYQVGGINDYSNYESAVKIQTDTKGSAQIYYVAPEFCGQETVTVCTTNADPRSRASKSQTITIAYPNLERLPDGNPDISYIGAKPGTPPGDAHPENHYGTPLLIQAITALARNYAAESTSYGDLPSHTLSVNDISLVAGGLFDINGQWTDAGGHIGHRLGFEVDVGGPNDGQKLIPPNINFERILGEQGFWDMNPKFWISESAAHPEQAHYHLVLNGSGKVSIGDRITGVSQVSPGVLALTMSFTNRGGLDASQVSYSIAADHGVTINTPTYSAGAAPIRVPGSFQIQAGIPSGVQKFVVIWTWTAISAGVPRTFGYYNCQFIQVPNSDVPGPEPGPRPLDSGISFVLNNPFQTSIPGGTNVFSGTIQNGSAANLFLSSIQLQFVTAAPSGTYSNNWAPEFLASGGLIPPGGAYTGPVVDVSWLTAPPVGDKANGSISFTALSGTNPVPLAASFHSSYLPQTLSINQSGTNVVLSWSTIASNLTALESADVADPVYLPVDAPVVQTNGLNTVTLPASGSADFFELGTMPPGGAPPTILQEPQSQTVFAGSSANVAVQVIGAQPISFQWQLNGTNLLGETNSSIVLPTVLPGNAGGYSVYVWNSFGAALSTPATLTVALPPDLAPVSVTAVSNSVTFYPSSAQNPVVPVVGVVTNQGPGVASNVWAFWYDRVYVSTNTSLTGTVLSQDIGIWDASPLAAGSSYTETNLIALPEQSGTYYLIYQANSYLLDGDGSLDVSEVNTNNNLLVAAAPVTVAYQVIPPDLSPVTVAAFSNSVTFYPPSPQNPVVPFFAVVTNQGPGSASSLGGTWYDRVYVSTSANLSGTILSQDIAISDYSPLAASSSYTETNLIALPQQSGTYYLIYEVNAYFLDGYGFDNVYEVSTNNNLLVAAAPVTVTYRVIPPDLAPVRVSALSNSVTFYPPSPQNPVVPVIGVVTNQGPGVASNVRAFWYDRVYVSTNRSLSGTVLSQDIGIWDASPLASGNSYTETNLIALPQQSGTYYLIYEANSYFLNGKGSNEVYEVNTNNNLLVAAAPVTVTYQVIPPDLAPVSVTAVSNSVTFYPPSPQNPVVPVIGVVTNQGPGVASNVWAFWYDRVYVSTNTSLSGTVLSQDIGIGNGSPLPAGSSYTETNLIALPEQSGTYYLIYQANSYFLDGSGYYGVYEVNTNNNLLVAAAPVTVTYQVIPPDLAPVSVTAVSNSVTFYPPSPQNPVVPVIGVVTNQGPGVASNVWAFWYDRVYVSTNTSLSGTVLSQDIGIGNGSPLPAGSSYAETNLIALPEQSGTYYLIYQANSYFLDGSGYYGVYEVNTNNNLLSAAAPVTVTYQVIPPDLAPVSVTAVSNSVTFYPPSPQNPVVPVVGVVTNQGPGVASNVWAFWYDRVYVSTNTSLSGTVLSQDIGIGNGSPLPAGSSYAETNLIALPEQSGTYYLIYQANSYFLDGSGYYDVYEVNTNNNLLSAAAPVMVTYQVIPPDLAPVTVTALSNSVTLYPSSPQNPVVPVVGVVTNQGPGVAVGDFGSWYDRVYVSTNTSLSGTVLSQDIRISYASPLAAGGSYAETNLITLPEQSGTYYLIYQANSYFLDGYGYYDVYEVNTNNNLLSAAAPVMVTYQVIPPDLAPVSVTAVSNSVTFYPPSPQNPVVPVVGVVTNRGPGVAFNDWAFWYDTVYVTTNASLSGTILSQDIGIWNVSPLAAEGSYTETNLITLPEQSGTYYLIYQANSYFLDGYGYYDVYEVNTNNNLLAAAAPVTVVYQVVPIGVSSYLNNPFAQFSNFYNQRLMVRWVSGKNIVLSWPTNAVGFTLQSTTNLPGTGIWTVVTNPPVVAGINYVVTNTITGNRTFYRIIK